MNPKPLTPEQTEALHAAGDEPLPVIDLTNQQIYVVVDRDVHRRAMEALRQREDIAAIQAGIDDMEAGRHSPVDESFARIKEKLLARERQ